jgi:hypothetical protein
LIAAAGRVAENAGIRAFLELLRPVFMTRHKDLVDAPSIDSIDVYDLVLKHLRVSHAR